MTVSDSLAIDIRRPRLLLQAARYSAKHYRRDRDLRRISGITPLGSSGDVLKTLLAQEAELDALRRVSPLQAGRYSIARHIDLLAAILCELPRCGPLAV
ncbi:DUF6477 family protein [Thioclava sp. GXIMD4216]|uniref:DUF6477 family protein n=1 Tax=Thioclava sp. GXIMD4216 TaxID=3131929 RepID=UPI0030D5A8A9